jgi:hypothetical protein
MTIINVSYIYVLQVLVKVLLLHLDVTGIPLYLLDYKFLSLALITLTQTSIQLVKVIHNIYEVILVLRVN